MVSAPLFMTSAKVSKRREDTGGGFSLDLTLPWTWRQRLIS